VAVAAEVAAEGSDVVSDVVLSEVGGSVYITVDITMAAGGAGATVVGCAPTTTESITSCDVATDCTSQRGALRAWLVCFELV
jgi:hypothetical protein